MRVIPDGQGLQQGDVTHSEHNLFPLEECRFCKIPSAPAVHDDIDICEVSHVVCIK